MSQKRLQEWAEKLNAEGSPLGETLMEYAKAWQLEREENLRGDALSSKADVASKALCRAWQLGQDYAQQVESRFESQSKNADKTYAKFQALVDETRAAILAEGVGGRQELRKDGTKK